MPVEHPGVHPADGAFQELLPGDVLQVAGVKVTAQPHWSPPRPLEPAVAASVHGSLHARVVLAFAMGTVSSAQTKSGY